METYTIAELANILDVHQDTLRKAVKRGYASRMMAPELEQLSGIDRREWCWPSNGNPFDKILKG